MTGWVVFGVIVIIWLLVAPIMALIKSAEAKLEAAKAAKEVYLLRKDLAELRVLLAGKNISSALEGKVDVDHAIMSPPAPPELRSRDIIREQPPIPLPMVAPLKEQAAQVEIPFKAGKEMESEEAKEPFSWEKFMGVKLFAWLGGLAMFFGVIFFVKYAFENNLISPAARIGMGLLTGLGLLVGGWVTHRFRRYRVLGQAFCATGVVILYGVIFAAHAVYHFPAFGAVSTFFLMALVTAVAFISAVRLRALVVAILGMLGGFLTPVLLATGQDQLFGLFGYIVLLDVGLLAVSRYYKWSFLATSAAVLTGISQVVWFLHFFDRGNYSEGLKTWILMGLLVVFLLLFATGGALNRKKRKADQFDVGAILFLASVAMLFAFTMLGYRQVSERYVLLHGFSLLVQVIVFSMVLIRSGIGRWLWLLGGLAFLHLASWTHGYLTVGNLLPVLGIYLTFGSLHAAGPFLISRFFANQKEAFPLKLGPWFGSMVLGMIFLSLVMLPSVPIYVWFAVLLADVLVVALAIVTGAMLPVLASLFFTMILAGTLLLKAPLVVDSQTSFLVVVTLFAAAFVFAGRKLSRLTPRGVEFSTTEQQAAALLPIFSGGLPFVLLVMALLRLPIENPSAIFGVAALMAGLMMGLSVVGKQGYLTISALIGVLGVEAVWHANHFQSVALQLPLAWYLGFYAFFLGFPFLFRKQCVGLPQAWIASALAGVGHFLLVYNLVKHAHPNGVMGLIPAAFAIPSMVAFYAVMRKIPENEGDQQSRLAWYGGVALLFITLIFPIQFERQWLTVSWAMEGALLLWFYRRVPHPGLLFTALFLLLTSFVRLTVNPAVFTSYSRSGTAIFNWHLYTYGIVAVACFLAGKWFTDPAGRCARYPVRGLLFGAGGVLLFLLLNIEIADYFTASGSRFIAFQFGGNFARDMAYSIAWGLFSLSLLVIGIWRKSPHARYAAIGLLVITLLKLFIHDLASLESIFRIGALIGVAIIAFAASFIYQRFLQEPEK